MTVVLFFFFNDTATTEIYTLSLHDALPICTRTSPSCFSVVFVYGSSECTPVRGMATTASVWNRSRSKFSSSRSEEHTSELQSQSNLVCRLLLEKKKHNAACFKSRYSGPLVT